MSWSPPTFHLASRARWLPKAGNATGEYEDAFWLGDAWPVGDAAGPFRCAVGDGATETSFAGLWANLLVAAFGEGRLDPADLAVALPPLQRAWRERAGARPLPWYAEAKLRDGAFSSLLGLEIAAPAPGAAGGVWEAVAVGDSCLFVVRAGRLRVAFPLARADEFDNRPLLIASAPDANRELGRQIAGVCGRWEAGDEFYLATDALACSLLAAVARGDAPWETLRLLMGDDEDAAPPAPQSWGERDGAERVAPPSIGGPGGPPAGNAFADWIAELRLAGAIRNDDVTLLRVTVGSAPAPPVNGEDGSGGAADGA